MRVIGHTMQISIVYCMHYNIKFDFRTQDFPPTKQIISDMGVRGQLRLKPHSGEFSGVLRLDL